MISIVICTYNRASSLRKTLESLRQMTVPPDLKWELIVVDNNSRDNTREVVEEFKLTSGIDVRHILEPKQGLGNARNAGITSARGEIVAFTDDDIFADANWLSNIWKEFSSDKDLQVLGGQVKLADPRDLPRSIIRCTTRKMIQSFDDTEECLIGCCWAFRRSVFEDAGEFDPLLGPGATFCNADDLDYKYRLAKRGCKMLYAPSVLVFHNHGRRTREAEAALLRTYDIGRGAVFAKHFVSGDMFAGKLMYWTIMSRARHSFRVRDIPWGCRRTSWVIAGFVGYIAYRASRALNPRERISRTASNPGTSSI